MQKLLFVLILSVVSVLSVFSADRCPAYNKGDKLPAYMQQGGYMVPVCPANYQRLGILPRVDAVPETGKIITKSHGVLQNGQWMEIIDEQLTQAEIDARNPVIALQSALSAEITRLNAAYTGLNLTTADTLVTAIPKLFAAGVSKSDSAFLFTLYQAIKEAGK